MQMNIVAKRRIIAYLAVNSFCIAVSWVGLFLVTATAAKVGSITTKAAAMACFVSNVFRMWCCVEWWNWLASTKQRMTVRDSTKECVSLMGPILKMIFVGGTVDLILTAILVRDQWRINQVGMPSSMWEGLVEYLRFVPQSLYLELVFDFFHYWMHRTAHKVKPLFRWYHYDHHLHQHPGPWSTFEQSIGDAVLSYLLPLVWTFTMGPKLSLWQFYLFMTYKTYVEVAGHCGSHVRGPTFPQCPLVGFYTNICLEVGDHHEHHRLLHGNYSKRFKLWDLVFGTYIQHKFHEKKGQKN